MIVLELIQSHQTLSTVKNSTKAPRSVNKCVPESSLNEKNLIPSYSTRLWQPLNQEADENITANMQDHCN